MRKRKESPVLKLAKNTGWLIGAKVYQIAVNLVVSVWTARYLGPGNYGLVSYAAALTALFTCFCTLGLNSILVNELLRNREENGAVLGTAIGLRLLSGALSAITVTALSYLLDPDEPATVALVGMYSLASVFQSFDALASWYQSRLRSRVTAVISAIGYTAAAAYRVVGLVTKQNALWFAAAHGVEYALAAGLLLLAYTGNGPRLRWDKALGKELLSKSYHFILSGLMVALYGQMDRVMLKAMAGERAVGYYSAAAAIASMWPFVLQALIDSAKPLLLERYERDFAQYRRWLTRLYGAILYISFAAAIGITLLSKKLLLLLYAEAYLSARGALCILCWSTAFSYLGVARSIWLVPRGKQMYEKYIALAGAVCNLLLNGFLIPIWGVNGAALATLLTQVFTNFAVGFFLKEVRQNNILILRAFCFWRDC